MGHRLPGMGRRYTHLTIEHLREELERVSPLTLFDKNTGKSQDFLGWFSRFLLL